MTTVDARLRDGITRHGEDFTLTLDPSFQGLPDTAHGGSVLAAFHAIAGIAGCQEVQGLYRKRVPLGTPLRLDITSSDGAVACRLFDETDAILVDGRVESRSSGVSPQPRLQRPRVSETLPSSDAAGDPLPVSSTCFVCGVKNEVGLRAQLAFDFSQVTGTWRPREEFRARDGSLAPIALTSLLDEAAFWLGALATGESGMTTELLVTLSGSIPFGVPLTVTGARNRVRRRADDQRYWDTEVIAHDASGRVIAEATITFVAVRGAARRLVSWILETNPPEIVRRVFPAYVPT